MKAFLYKDAFFSDKNLKKAATIYQKSNLIRKNLIICKVN